MPSGSKDPFGLRRSALSIIRILIEGNILINLDSLIEFTSKQINKKNNNGNIFTDNNLADKITILSFVFTSCPDACPIMSENFSILQERFKDSDLIDFSLELQNPSMIHEQEKIELMSQQLDIAEKAIDTKLFSRKWIYDNIFDLSDEEKISKLKK